jgi:hypothetical protein
MGSPFDAMFHLAGAPLLRQTFSVLVTLQRQGLPPTENVRVEPRKRDYEVVDPDNGQVQIVAVRDYLVEVSAYHFVGEAVKPRNGDRITELIAGVSCEFEVLPIDDKRPAAEPEDASGLRWLIHTKKVA